MPEDIVTVLTQDHDEARRLLKRLEDAKGDDAERTLEKLREAMVKHSRGEEELVYPFYRECLGSKDAKVDVAESHVEHENIDELMDAMVGLEPGSVDFAGRLKFLKESIEHHAGDEEKEMFPQMRKHCPPDQLQELAQEFKQRKKDLQVPSGKAGSNAGGGSKEELYKAAQEKDVEGRSEMSKKELQNALKRDH